MANRYMSEVNPNKGEKPQKDDGRESGEKGSPSSVSAKLTFSPNEDVKSINGGKAREGAEGHGDGGL